MVNFKLFLYLPPLIARTSGSLTPSTANKLQRTWYREKIKST